MRKRLLMIAMLSLALPHLPLQAASAPRALVLIAQPPGTLPKPTDYVSDFAHVLSPAAVKQIDHICSGLDHSKASTQVAIVTIKTLNGASARDYAKNLGNSWGVGKASRGIVLLLAIDDHQWRIAVGRGLESTLPDSLAYSIGQKMVPMLRAKNFDGAVITALQEIARTISSLH